MLTLSVGMREPFVRVQASEAEAALDAALARQRDTQWEVMSKSTLQMWCQPRVWSRGLSFRARHMTMIKCGHVIFAGESSTGRANGTRHSPFSLRAAKLRPQRRLRRKDDIDVLYRCHPLKWKASAVF